MDVALLEVALQFGAKLRTAEVIDVEGLVLKTHDAVLLLLHGEAGVDKEGGVAFFATAHEGHEACHAAHHGTDGRDAVFGFDFKVDEVLDEACSFLFQGGNALDVRVDGGDALLQGFDLCLHAHGARRKTGDAHLHTHKLLAGSLLDFVDQTFHLTDGGFANAADAAFSDFLIHNFCGNWCIFHTDILIVINSKIRRQRYIFFRKDRARYFE